MVKDSKEAATGTSHGDVNLSETSTPRLPSFESLETEERTAFSMSYDLLRYNLENMPLPPDVNHEAEAVAESASRELLGDSNEVNNLLRSPLGTQLSSSSLGQEMSRLADEFRASRQGTQADQLAASVNLSELSSNPHSFTDILEQLFHSGYNVESFVALFHFVARLLQRAYFEGGESVFKDLCKQLMFAFLTYLLANLIKFLANMFRNLSQRRQEALLGFLSGLAVASAACAVVGYFVLRNIDK
uniref:Miff domain-containing protein n=1 Tax=Macrostomum lignano TaxID=282301 RepID=A0A1I8IHC3_9PLAT